MFKERFRTSVFVFWIWSATTFLWWALAFFPTSENSPQWLDTAKSVCFGTLSNGLPDTWGWMILIFGPLSFLVAIVAAWGSDLKTALTDLWTKTHGKAIVLSSLATVLWGFSWVGFRVWEATDPARVDFSSGIRESLPENYPRTDKSAPGFQLIDQHGKQITLSSFQGKPLILTFAFAHCQTICPTIVHETVEAVTGFEDEVYLLVVTLDPWRDTPSSLPDLAEKWELPAHARVLSEEVPVVTSVLDRYEVPWSRNETDGDITHPALIYVIDGDGKIAFTFNNAPSHWIRDAVLRILDRDSV